LLDINDGIRVKKNKNNVFNSIRQSGYENVTKKIVKEFNIIVDGLKKMENIELLGNPYGPVIAWCVKGLDKLFVFRLMDALKSLGW